MTSPSFLSIFIFVFDTGRQRGTKLTLHHLIFNSYFAKIGVIHRLSLFLRVSRLCYKATNYPSMMMFMRRFKPCAYCMYRSCVFEHQLLVTGFSFRTERSRMTRISEDEDDEDVPSKLTRSVFIGEKTPFYLRDTLLRRDD